MRTRARAQSGLRSEIDRPSVTPAAASRARLRGMETGATAGASGASPRENGARSSGRTRQATSWRSAPARPHRATARGTSASTTSRSETSTPSAAIDVTALSGMPHGTMWPNMARSGRTLSANPCIVRPRVMRTPMAAILRGASVSAPTHTPG